MPNTHKLALLAAGLGLAIAPAGALAAGAHSAKAKPTVTVRIEGASKTLLPATTVTIPITGDITKGGTPAGKCPADTVAGALDLAVKHRWQGTYYASVGGIFVSSILSEKPKGADYWNLYVNDRVAQSGACAIKLRAGQQILFADNDGSELALVLRAQGSTHVGQTITVTAGAYGAKGFAAAKGVTITFAGHKLKTDRAGQVKIKITHTGTLVLNASGKGFVRAATVRVRELA